MTSRSVSRTGVRAVMHAFCGVLKAAAAAFALGPPVPRRAPGSYPRGPRPQPRSWCSASTTRPQLGGRAYHPGYLRAWLDRVRPAAVCVERDPEAFARGDYYEFTYEAQHVAVPYGRERGSTCVLSIGCSRTMTNA
jgi:hypothetical protein